MFLIAQPDDTKIAAMLEAARRLPAATPSLLTLERGLTSEKLPLGFSHDVSRSVLGRGSDTLDRAREALRRWAEFDLGWVRVANAGVPIETGKLVAVVAHTAMLWSVNVSRIVETLDTPVRFGFMYATTRMHVEEGQERFVLELDISGEVRFLIEAVSRPRHPLARLAWPYTRRMQRRFAREAHAQMRGR